MLWLTYVGLLLAVGGYFGWRWLGKHVFTPNLEVALGRDDPGPQMDRAPTIDYPAVKKWIRLGADVNAQAGASETALQVAVDRRDREFVTYLVAQGARMGVRSGPHGNDSPLKSACGSFAREPDLALVKLLLKAGADPVGDQPHYTPLHIAIGHLDLDLLNLLLESGAGSRQEIVDSALLTAIKLTPLDKDAQAQRQVTEVLLAKGANPNAISVYGYTTLQEAVRAAQVDSVHILLTHGGDAKRRCPDGTSVIKLANERRQLMPRRIDAIVKLLRAAGASE